MPTNDPDLKQRLPALAELEPMLEEPGFSSGQWAGGELTESGAIQMLIRATGVGARCFVAAVGSGAVHQISSMCGARICE